MRDDTSSVSSSSLNLFKNAPGMDFREPPRPRLLLETKETLQPAFGSMLLNKHRAICKKHKTHKGRTIANTAIKAAWIVREVCLICIAVTEASEAEGEGDDDVILDHKSVPRDCDVLNYITSKLLERSGGYD
ncbi:hypothetical protein Hypma_009690 [Hypsizygus marmoreus]|uniref:Uncharacterized protein n=1 Tax=Hypsizygus marmoreus TaxID=39966 RepID=A0A369JPJ7_HYPMA|nr:hypothetical protein Hypma_009690 [Hypsizygus marmoreus]